MKKLVNLFYASVLIMTGACSESVITDDVSSPPPLSATTRSGTEEPSPFSGAGLEFNFENALGSSYNGYTAQNVPVVRTDMLVVSNISDTTHVRKVFQNLVVISDSTGSEYTRFMVSLIPDVPTSENTTFRWADFLHLGEKRGFSGYEVRSSISTGTVFTVNYYQDGKYMYGVSLPSGGHDDAYEKAFIYKLLSEFRFYRLPLVNTYGGVHETTEEIIGFKYEGDFLVEYVICTVKWSWIDIDYPDDQDHGELPEGPPIGSNWTGGPFGISYTINPSDELFKDRVISYTNDAGSGSTPVKVVSMATMYGSNPKSIATVQQTITDKYGTNLNIYTNLFTQTDIMKVIGEFFYYRSVSDPRTSIRLHKPVFAAYKINYTSWYAVLVVGLTENDKFIIYDASSNRLDLINPSDLISGFMFELM